MFSNTIFVDATQTQSQFRSKDQAYRNRFTVTKIVIAGDFDEGHDDAEVNVRLREDGSWLVDGMTPVDEFEQLVGVRGLNDNEGYSTVAGLVMHLMRAVPKEGDKIEQGMLMFEVVDMDGRRVDKVLVRKTEPVDDDPSG